MFLHYEPWNKFLNLFHIETSHITWCSSSLILGRAHPTYVGDQDKHYYHSIMIVVLTDRIPVETWIHTDKLNYHWFGKAQHCNTRIVTVVVADRRWWSSILVWPWRSALSLIKLSHSEPGYRILGGDDRIGLLSAVGRVKPSDCSNLGSRGGQFFVSLPFHKTTTSGWYRNDTLCLIQLKSVDLDFPLWSKPCIS